jgi:alkylhydroperoxidase family enzyme
LTDPRQAALAKIARAIIEHHGWVPDADQEDFLAAGFTKRQLLDVVAIVSLKTLSNCVNHLAHTPLDPAFEAHRWTKAH